RRRCPRAHRRGPPPTSALAAGQSRAGSGACRLEGRLELRGIAATGHRNLGPATATTAGDGRSLADEGVGADVAGDEGVGDEGDELRALLDDRAENEHRRWQATAELVAKLSECVDARGVDACDEQLRAVHVLGAAREVLGLAGGGAARERVGAATFLGDL